jgi:hypothetical protein
MKTKGYRPAIENKEVKAIVGDLEALEELQQELIQRIEHIANSQVVTETELMRDFRFSPTGIRGLKEFRVLEPSNTTASDRQVYSAREALRLRTLLPGVCKAETMRIRRKYSNIVTVFRDLLVRVVRSPNSPSQETDAA